MTATRKFCVNGHDRTLPNALVNGTCVTCRQNRLDAKERRRSLTCRRCSHPMTQRQRVKAGKASTYAYCEPCSHRNNTGFNNALDVQARASVATARIEQLFAQLEVAMPWEKDAIRAEIRHCERQIRDGSATA